ncbi:MAG: hypothetical protein AABO58_11150 [Acidobacteriota bacterium]
MFPPTALRPYWLPVELELTLLEVAALSKLSPSRLYTRAKTFRSLRKRGSKLVFDRDVFLRYDLPALSPDFQRFTDPTKPAAPAAAAARSASAPAGRRGRHRPGCDRKETAGPCPVPPRTKKPKMPNDRKPRRGPRWTSEPKKPRRPHDRPVKPAAPKSSEPVDVYPACLPEQPTRTEAYLWRLAGGDPAKYEALAAEYSDEIAADREAGRIEPKRRKR